MLVQNWERKVAYYGEVSHLGKGIISYQEVPSSVLKNAHHYADEVINCNHIISGQLLKTSILIGCLCLGALWYFCLCLNWLKNRWR